jgi:hypothetical protein
LHPSHAAWMIQMGGNQVKNGPVAVPIAIGRQAEPKSKWSCGRVARQSSAKAPTAVRIRSGPQLRNEFRSFFYSRPSFLIFANRCRDDFSLFTSSFFTPCSSVNLLNYFSIYALFHAVKFRHFTSSFFTPCSSVNLLNYLLI